MRPRPNPDRPIPSYFFDVFPSLARGRTRTPDSTVSTRSEDAEIEEERSMDHAHAIEHPEVPSLGQRREKYELI